MPTFCLSNFLSICVPMCMLYVYMPKEADVPKPGRVHMDHVRPEINDVAVIYCTDD